MTESQEPGNGSDQVENDPRGDAIEGGVPVEQSAEQEAALEPDKVSAEDAPGEAKEAKE